VTKKTAGLSAGGLLSVNCSSKQVLPTAWKHAPPRQALIMEIVVVDELKTPVSVSQTPKLF
jgi:hypothetical protein